MHCWLPLIYALKGGTIDKVQKSLQTWRLVSCFLHHYTAKGWYSNDNVSYQIRMCLQVRHGLNSLLHISYVCQQHQRKCSKPFHEMLYSEWKTIYVLEPGVDRTKDASICCLQHGPHMKLNWLALLEKLRQVSLQSGQCKPQVNTALTHTA